MSDALSLKQAVPAGFRTSCDRAVNGALTPSSMHSLGGSGRPILEKAIRLVSLRPPVPRTTAERMLAARDRIQAAALAGQRIRSYEVALDLDLSEFHFARQFRIAFGRSPHVFYDEVRAESARSLLELGHPEGEVARRVGFRRPAELRALLSKRQPRVIEGV